MEIFVQGIMCLWFLKYGAPWMELEMDGMQGCTNKFALCVANVFFILWNFIDGDTLRNFWVSLLLTCDLLLLSLPPLP